MKSQAKVQPACDITIGVDHGSLRLQFPSRHVPLLKALGLTKYLPLGKQGYKDNPEDWKRATQLAIALEADLDHSEWDKLFDPTLAKYGLGGGKYAKLADVLQMPGTVPALPEITVGEMWEAYLEWKQEKLEPTTFLNRFCKTYTNVIKGLVWDKTKLCFDDPKYSVWDLPISSNIAETLLTHPVSDEIKRKTLVALAEAFTRLQSQGKTSLTTNPFVVIGSAAENKTDKYKSTITAKGEIQEWWQIDDTETDSDERDRRAFTKDERDIIVKAFYESDKLAARQAAPLIEFRFLTGCRSGEAFALRWQDVFIGHDKNYIRFSKSYNGQLKNTQVTKTGEVRLFKIYPKLNDLLLRVKPDDAKSTDLIFTKLNGKYWDSMSIGKLWNCSTITTNESRYTYPGIVTQLVEQGVIGGYLSPYHTRHTFITLMAHAGTDLLLLATACGNSVEVIQRHYLGINTEASFPDI